MAAMEKAKRLVSLDLLRGLTIFGMFLVNNPGTWGAIYPPFRHAEWNGCTFTDLIFPFFLFMVGMSVKLSLDSRIRNKVPGKALVVQIVKRSALLFLLGLFLSAYKGMRTWELDLSTLRIMGVLQRIALCYLCSSLVYLKIAKGGVGSGGSEARAVMKVCAVILVGYFLVMRFVPVPGFGAGQFDSKEGNVSAWVDRMILGNHVWAGAGVYDPEGLLSTLPAIASCLSGILCAFVIKREEPVEKRLMDLFAYGSLLAVAGWAATALMPLNKALWSSSYVLYTSGLAFVALGLCYWYADYHGQCSGITPFVALGTNALPMFVLSGIIGRELYLWKIGDKFLKPWMFDNLFKSWLGDFPGSLAFAACFAGALTLLSWYMYKKEIIIKV